MGSKTTVRVPEGKEWPIAPEGLHQAVCVDVWDIYPTKRDEQYGGGIVDQTRIVWQLDLESPEGRRYEVMAIYTASLHEKAKLRKHLESWRGRQFTQQELQGFELENVIGANCQIQVIHRLCEQREDLRQRAGDRAAWQGTGENPGLRGLRAPQGPPAGAAVDADHERRRVHGSRRQHGPLLGGDAEPRPQASPAQ